MFKHPAVPFSYGGPGLKAATRLDILFSGCTSPLLKQQHQQKQLEKNKQPGDTEKDDSHRKPVPLSPAFAPLSEQIFSSERNNVCLPQQPLTFLDLMTGRNNQSGDLKMNPGASRICAACLGDMTRHASRPPAPSSSFVTDLSKNETPEKTETRLSRSTPTSAQATTAGGDLRHRLLARLAIVQNHQAALLKQCNENAQLIQDLMSQLCLDPDKFLLDAEAIPNYFQRTESGLAQN